MDELHQKPSSCQSLPDYHSKVNPISENRNVFTKFINLIRHSIPSDDSKKSTSLKGRIVEEEALNAENLFQQLMILGEKAHDKIDRELSNSFEFAIDKVLRDFRRLQKKDQNSQKVDWNGWMIKATKWIALDAKLHDRAAVIDAITTQTLLQSDELIDQDIRLIHDYIAHSLEDLPLGNEQKQVLEQEIHKALEGQIEALFKLKKKPARLDFQQIEAWKDAIGHQRSACFEKALQIIDGVIGR